MVRQEQRALKAAQRRWPRSAELEQMGSRLVTVRLALKALLIESLMGATLSKVRQALMLLQVRSAQLIQQPIQYLIQLLQSALRHPQCS